ncbi:IS630 family transposase [Phormidesmis sp. 146-12]
MGLLTTLGKRITALGVKPAQPVQWPREAIWLYGVVAPSTGESFFYEFSHLDTACFEVFLDLVAQAYPHVLNVIQVDQAPAHSSHKLCIPENIVLLYQPPHSPELNPIERLWEDLKLDFKGEIFATLDELRTALREVLGYLTPDWIAAVTQYPFIMNALSVSISS